MTWRVEWDDHARRELRRLDHPVQRTILRYFAERIATGEEERLVVLVLAVGHRRQIYG